MEYRDIYARANEYLQNRRYDLALKSFEQLTFMRPDVTYFCASFVYLRSRVCDWSEYVNCILCSTSSSHSNSQVRIKHVQTGSFTQGRSETTSQDERRSKISRCGASHAPCDAHFSNVKT